ncbi:tenascin-N isoform X2 [Gouania willdenowi]|uniref:tenascin-N isoform X2 n=1 Tax=Gouania willdenowi TaxID=441366 RepID=UPI0010560909|nr:tenascin-N-like isoform X2 [Gouania willdenowi]
MIIRLLWRALLALLCTAPPISSADNHRDTNAPEQGVTFNHIFTFDIPGSCKVENVPTQDATGLQMETKPNGENHMTFRHNIRLRMPTCKCEESESFKSLLYRVNGLEEEVTYLKSQCTQGCCGASGASGLDTSCSGHGTYQQETCSCLCFPGWEGLDCSLSFCPDECNDNGRCINGKCVCYQGFTGDDCSQVMCPDNCNDNGRCVDGKCVCYQGFTGDDCSQAMCPDNCSGNGRCVDGKCVCHQGFTGDDCSQAMCPDNCNDNGRCVDGKCVCHQGFTGDDCSQAMCPDNCNDKGLCVDGRCVCFPHFTGQDCSTQKCPNDCISTGRCVDGQCVCNEGFYGDNCSLVYGPRGLQVVEVTDVSLLVKWESVHGAEHYILTYHPEYDEEATEQVHIPNTENSHLITGLTPGVTYFVQVQTVIKEIQSETNRIEATTDVSGVKDIKVLGQTEVSIQVDWQNPQSEVDYFRLTHTDPAGQKKELSVQKSQEAHTKHTIIGLYPGTEYLISVQAVHGSSEGKSSSVTGVTDIDAPTHLITTEVSEDTATVSWDPVQAAIEGYMLNYISSEGSISDIPVGRDITSYRLVGLKPGVLHTVYIWAYRGDNVSKRISTDAETDMDSPKDLKAIDVTSDSASLSWIPPLADIDGYILTYRDEDGNMEPVEKQLGAGESSFTVFELETGKRYVVTILAYKGAKRTKVVETIFETIGKLYSFPMDCLQVLKNGNKHSGLYTIYISSDLLRPLEIYCDMETDGGGWMVLQRRNIGKLDFMKRWRQYIAGFGNMTEEFWIGLEKIYELTSTPTQYELRFDLGLGSERAYAVYDNFKIAPVKQKFKLTIGKYSGTAGDAMTYHQGRPWTTVDSDNDIALGNCALTHRGAWWYKNCHLANLNGKWGDNRHSLGVNWEPWKGHLRSLDFTEMKIRPVGALSSRGRRSLIARRRAETQKPGLNKNLM